jgi:hypothetical protein
VSSFYVGFMVGYYGYIKYWFNYYVDIYKWTK